MAYDITGRRKPTKPKKQARSQKRKRDDVDVEKLQRSVDSLDARASFSKFTDLPLSEPTKAGLKACHFASLTEIQAKAIPLGLSGADILGAAKTGSGKTLAFLVPVLENLYRQQCVGSDAGLGAMIISPTRELAIQIFDVLYKIGKCGHMFAAGLVIGGKSLQEEQHALARMNIVVCTPGRMLQHLSQTAAFNVDNLRMLVLDEADRILDMGFQRDLDAIIEYLPQDRQTLLFSATQTKNVSDLARLSLRDPEYVAVHESATTATPKTLQQNYVLTPLPSKLDTLWSFLQSSKKSKLLVFLSSGKQVRFIYESFRKLQPGIPLLHLHGRQRQSQRLDITTRFSSAKFACLFATDVVARGIDFPAVDWVVQVDCPEDADTYIHRVGRTARYERDGRAVLLLDPSEEEGMLERLAAKKVPIERINVRARKQQSIKNQLQALSFKDPELKYLGQKAFASYVRSVHLQKHKDIFKIESYALEEFAASLGLPGAPRIKFIKGDGDASRKAKNAPRQAVTESDSERDEDRDDNGQADERTTNEVSGPDTKAPVRTKYDRMFERRNQDILSAHYSRMIAPDDEANAESSSAEQDAADAHSPLHEANNRLSEVADLTAADDAKDDDDGLFTVKRRIPALPDAQPEDGASRQLPPLIVDSNRRARALKSRKATARLLGTSSTKLVFDDAGEAHAAHPFKSEAEAFADGEREEARRRFVEDEGAKMRDRDVQDREVAREKKRAKREKRKIREREERMEGAGEGEEYEDGEDGEDAGGGFERIERPFEELRDLYPSEEEQSNGGELDEAAGSRGDVRVTNGKSAKKTGKKWFQTSSSDSDRDGGERQNGKRKKKEKKRHGAQLAEAPAETLEDLERLASGLLG